MKLFFTSSCASWGSRFAREGREWFYYRVSSLPTPKQKLPLRAGGGDFWQEKFYRMSIYSKICQSGEKREISVVHISVEVKFELILV